MKHLCTLIYIITLLKHTDNELKWLGLVKQFIEIFISKAMLLESHSTAVLAMNRLATRLANITQTLCHDGVWSHKLQHTHTHTFNSPLSGTIRVSRYQKRNVKPTWILLKRETVSGSGISWAMCKSAPRSRQIIMPAPHHSVFTGRMPFLPPNQEHQSTHTHTRLTALFRDYPGEPVPER